MAQINSSTDPQSLTMLAIQTVKKEAEFAFHVFGITQDDENFFQFLSPPPVDFDIVVLRVEIHLGKQLVQKTFHFHPNRTLWSDKAIRRKLLALLGAMDLPGDVRPGEESF